jgi:hypothetical protein
MVCGYSQVKEYEVRTVRGARGCDITLKVLQGLFNYAFSALWLLFYVNSCLVNRKYVLQRITQKVTLQCEKVVCKVCLHIKEAHGELFYYVFYEQCLYTNMQLKEWSLKCFKFFLWCVNRKVIGSIFMKCVHCFKRKVLIWWLLADSHIFYDVLTT